MSKRNEAIKAEMMSAYEEEVDKLLCKLDAKEYNFVEFEQRLIEFSEANSRAASELVQEHKHFSPSGKDM